DRLGGAAGELLEDDRARERRERPVRVTRPVADRADAGDEVGENGIPRSDLVDRRHQRSRRHRPREEVTRRSHRDRGHASQASFSATDQQVRRWRRAERRRSWPARGGVASDLWSTKGDGEMSDEELRSNVADELSWEPKVDSSSIAVA